MHICQQELMLIASLYDGVRYCINYAHVVFLAKFNNLRINLQNK